MEPEKLVERIAGILHAKLLFYNKDDHKFALKKSIKIKNMPLYKTGIHKDTIVETIIYFEMKEDSTRALSAYLQIGNNTENIFFKHVLMAWFDEHDHRTSEDNKILFKLSECMLV